MNRVLKSKIILQYGRPKDFAEHMNKVAPITITTNILSEISSGARVISLPVALLFARELDTTVEEIFGDHEAKISDFTSGEKHVSLPTALLLARSLGSTVEELFGSMVEAECAV